jgi:hypothetical protein
MRVVVVLGGARSSQRAECDNEIQTSQRHTGKYEQNQSLTDHILYLVESATSLRVGRSNCSRRAKYLYFINALRWFGIRPPLSARNWSRRWRVLVGSRTTVLRLRTHPVAKVLHRLDTTSARAGREDHPEPAPPEPNRLTGDVDPEFTTQVLDFPE